MASGVSMAYSKPVVQEAIACNLQHLGCQCPKVAQIVVRVTLTCELMSMSQECGLSLLNHLLGHLKW